MFQFPWLATYTYVFSVRSWGFAPTGFPIRTSPDHSLFSSFPELIAAIHVLHRLSIPGHSLYALSSLILSLENFTSTKILKLDILPYAIVKDQSLRNCLRKLKHFLELIFRSLKWSAQEELNFRPPPYQSGALTN